MEDISKNPTAGAAERTTPVTTFSGDIGCGDQYYEANDKVDVAPVVSVPVPVPDLDENANTLLIPAVVPARRAHPSSPSPAPASSTTTPTGTPLSQFANSLQARVFTVILMHGIGIIALICEGHLFYRDLEWNWVLDGKSSVNFPTSDLNWSKKFISFRGGEGEELRKLLRRDVVLPVICMIIIGALFIVNIVTQTYDLKHRHKYLSWAAGLYAFIGASLMTVGTIQIVLIQEYITNVYGTVRRTLTNDIPVDEDYLPGALPEGDPVSVEANAEFFLQVFESCRNGDVSNWAKKSQLLSIGIKVPSYRQLIQMGFCINSQFIIVPAVILAILTVLSWLNVFLCLKIWRMYIVSLPPPPRNNVCPAKLERGGSGK